jgi:hypothetical protein
MTYESGLFPACISVLVRIISNTNTYLKVPSIIQKFADFTIGTLTYCWIVISVSNNLEIIVSAKQQWFKAGKASWLNNKNGTF